MTVTFETYGQVFKVRLSGVSRMNEDGSSRQDLLARCRAGEPVELRRERDNPHDRWAIAVHRPNGSKLGYIPAGDRRLAEHIDRGGQVSAHILQIDGGPSFFDRVFGRKGRYYGCGIEIEKGSYDWKRVEPFLKLDREAGRLVKKAKGREGDIATALKLYEQAWTKILELDSRGELAQAWRTTCYPINRMSLLLERQGEAALALQLIERYQASGDPVGLTKSDAETVRKRRERLKKKVNRQTQ